MKNLIKVYRWEDGEILEREVSKSAFSTMTGWKTEPDEAMISQLETKRYVVENLMYDMQNRVDEMILLENQIGNIEGFEKYKLPESNGHGLSINRIEKLVEKLNQLLLKNI